MTASFASVLLGHIDFNSHARVGRDMQISSLTALHSISTHTPAWGVTVISLSLFVELMISTHTPAWGVTVAFSGAEAVVQFQLTRPRGA